MKETARQLLIQHSVVITRARLTVLTIFLDSSEELNLSILEKKVADTINRATVYRILKVFSDAGLLQVVPSVDGTMRYVLQLDGSIKNPDIHIHFLCCKCGRISSMGAAHFPVVEMPDSYQVDAVEVFIKGICADCH